MADAQAVPGQRHARRGVGAAHLPRHSAVVCRRAQFDSGQGNLGDMYVSDPRYVETYDETFGLPGLAAYCRAAIHANADRRA